MKTILLILGFPKCGTSSLYYWLSDHPDISPSNPKETFFFMDKECLFQPPWKTQHSGGDFASFFARDNKDILLEASPFHFDQKTCFEYAGRNKNVKAIFVLRSPELRMYSSYLFFTQVIQGLRINSFSEFVDVVMHQSCVKGSLREIRFDYVLNNAFEWGRYVHYLDKWRSALGNDRIFIGALEEMETFPLTFLQKVCAWLGVSSRFFNQYNFKAINQSYSVRFPEVHRRLREIAGFNPMSKEELDTHLNSFYFLKSKRMRHCMNSLYSMLQIKKNEMTPDDRKRIEQLKDMYRLDNLALLSGYGIKY
ncbi:conserved hypothetical protein [Hahella chejuensis KCTC 2396]|uniref:Sulfotransferase domain-containing protein n=1 Tax=Hahella chejuensis (strain KCTC 2396) TaxID=349521 RepID=Q2SGP2_HAHCH|nr:sulfotransferase domain-containing protein [Hahella chejuensis]ABC30182.1 conserved hypothetical protein [Hahella chejuensis KCTC 2396]